MPALLYQNLISEENNIEGKLHELLQVVRTIEQEFRNFNFYPYLTDLKILRGIYRNFLYKKEFGFEICERLGIKSKYFYKENKNVEKIVEYSIPLIENTIRVGEEIQEELFSKNKIEIENEDLLSLDKGTVVYHHLANQKNYYFNFMFVNSKKPNLIITCWQEGEPEGCRVKIDFWLTEASALDLIKAFIAKKIWRQHRILEN